MSSWQELKDRAADKWQVPVLFLSLVLLGASVLQLRPTPQDTSPLEASRHLEKLVRGGAFNRAIVFGDQYVARRDLDDADVGTVHLWLARARSSEARRRGVARADIGHAVQEHYAFASKAGESLTGSDLVQLGRALEWQRKDSAAVEAYEQALQRGVADPLDLRRHILSLSFDKLDTPLAQRHALLDDFLADLGAGRVDLRFWAVEQKLKTAHRLGELAAAATLLTTQSEYFKSTGWRDRFAYLEAWFLYETGHFDEAETHLRTILSRVERHDPVDAMAGWLLGRAVMSDGGPKRPLEALSFFSNVIEFHPDDEYAVASRVGTGEALALLERHDEALEAFRLAAEELETGERSGPVDRDVLRTTLSILADGQRRGGRLTAAVGYARLAVTLLQGESVEVSTVLLRQLAGLETLRAEELDGETAAPRDLRSTVGEASTAPARAAFGRAAETFLRLAHLEGVSDRKTADAIWQAANLFARAAERRRAGELYEAFVRERPGHPLAPRALLHIGRLRQMSGRLQAAVEAYRECYRRFPRSLDAARALIPLARCYLVLGPDYADLAEKTLHIVLDDSEVFTPRAPEFADAMILLGEAQSRRGEFEGAITILEEVLERYPDDARVWRVRSLLADAYRQSGLALKGEVARARFAEEMKRMRAEAAARFAVAQRLYRAVITEYELRDPTSLNRLQRASLRYAYLYEADCLFERQSYQRALALYEQAVGLYKNSPSALAAYVQIINCQVFLGQPRRARTALARARVLADAIPEEAFERSVGPEGREDWKRYFDWLAKSELF